MFTVVESNRLNQLVNRPDITHGGFAHCPGTGAWQFDFLVSLVLHSTIVRMPLLYPALSVIYPSNRPHGSCDQKCKDPRSCDLLGTMPRSAAFPARLSKAFSSTHTRPQVATVAFVLPDPLIEALLT